MTFKKRVEPPKRSEATDFVPKTQAVTAEVFDGHGAPIDVEPHDPAGFAKIETTGNRKRYYCKVRTSGKEAGQLANVHGTFTRPNTSMNKTVHGVPLFKYQQVPIQAFELYLKFLETSRTAYLLQAERERKTRTIN